jgi:hypothetical protein
MCLLQACVVRWSADIQWDAAKQILRSEDSQVELRSIQTQVFDTTDKITLLRATVAIMQDLAFEIDVLDEELGVVSGKKWITQMSSNVDDPAYYNYKTDQLMLFHTSFRSWQSFHYRNDLTRMTVTVRPKETTRSIVRVSIQYNIKPFEDPEVYQAFFKTLQQSLLRSAEIELCETQDCAVSPN